MNLLNFKNNNDKSGKIAPQKVCNIKILAVDMHEGIIDGGGGGGNS